MLDSDVSSEPLVDRFDDDGHSATSDLVAETVSISKEARGHRFSLAKITLPGQLTTVTSVP